MVKKPQTIQFKRNYTIYPPYGIKYLSKYLIFLEISTSAYTLTSPQISSPHGETTIRGMTDFSWRKKNDAKKSPTHHSKWCTNSDLYPFRASKIFTKDIGVVFLAHFVTPSTLPSLTPPDNMRKIHHIMIKGKINIRLTLLLEALLIFLLPPKCILPLYCSTQQA